MKTSLPTFFEILPKFLKNQNVWGCTCTPSSYTADAAVYPSWQAVVNSATDKMLI